MSSARTALVGAILLALLLSATASAQGPRDSKSNGPATINAMAEAFGTYIGGTGLYGLWVDNTNGAYGIVGQITSPGAGGNTTAVLGRNSGYGQGVYGYSQYGFGQIGWSDNNIGVFGRHGTTSGNSSGVWGDTLSKDAAAMGVVGVVWDKSPGFSSTGVGGVNQGTNSNGYGVWGAHAGSGAGVYGFSNRGIGVQGVTYEAGGSTVGGVVGESLGEQGNGVIGVANNGSAAYGILGASTSGFAGWFNGRVNVNGTLSKAAGSFKIDHPLDPANKYLSHSFVESPDMMNVYNGNIKLDEKGEAWVTLPEWFETLNRDFRYQLTAIGAPGPNLYVAHEVSGNRFKIAGGQPNSKVSWQVTGIRQDAYAKAHPIIVEEDKPAAEKGSYLQPELFGQPQSKSIEAAYGKQMEHVERAPSLPSLDAPKLTSPMK